MKFLAINSFFLLLLSFGASFAQEKFEKEYRIKAADVPLAARQFVDSLDFNRKVRWYMEVSQQGKSIEAKSKRNGQRYSVEFGLLGDLQDVEISISRRRLPVALRQEIEESLDAEFDKYKITKVQRQFMGARREILGHLTERSGDENLTVRYEIVLKGRKRGETNEFEYTYAADGVLEKRAKISLRNTDNLEY